VKARFIIAAAAVLLFAFQAWLRLDDPPATPGLPAGVLFQPLAPLVVALTWAEAQAAIDDRRVVDALDRLRLLEALDPDSPEATVFRAHLLAHNLAERADADGAAARIAEAHGVLVRAEERSKDPRLPLARGQLLLEARMWAPDLARRLERHLGHSPRAEATLALEEALRRAPGSVKVRSLAMTAWRLRGIEILGSAAPLDQAAVAFTRSAELCATLEPGSLGRALAIAWERLVRAIAAGATGDVAGAGDEFLRTFERWRGVRASRDVSEAAFAGALVRRGVALAEERVARRDGAGALSVLSLVITIRNVVASSLDSSRVSSIRDLADPGRVVLLLGEIERLEPALSPDVGALRNVVARW
jgi:hypothetical protein